MSALNTRDTMKSAINIRHAVSSALTFFEVTGNCSKFTAMNRNLIPHGKKPTKNGEIWILTRHLVWKHQRIVRTSDRSVYVYQETKSRDK